MSQQFDDIVARLQAGADIALAGGLKGLEKESLRVGEDGAIARTAHPQALGAALTHPRITTDYSEALLEFVTGPAASPAKVLAELSDVHRFVYPRIGDELLWVTSMPCVLAPDNDVPIAQYGTSNVGRMKHVYRVGLGHRYGRAMQAIAGVHFNYSPPASLWPVLADVLARRDSDRAFIDDCLMGMLRNLKRGSWLVSYLFGSSPAVCKSFVRAGGAGLQSFDRNTWFYPHGTSLRLSDLGYSNRAVAGLRIPYDSLAAYVEGLSQAIETPHPPYQRIGVKRDGEYLQLNANVLQIENEYYSYVRPKRSPQGNEKRTAALAERGIEYVELRSLDLDPWAEAGVAETTMRFLEAFMLTALLAPSPAISGDRHEELDHNLLTVATRGREPGLELQSEGERLLLSHWANRVLDAVEGVAELLDADAGGDAYRKALAAQRVKVEDPSATPSAAVLREMRDQGEGFFYFAMRRSEALRDANLARPLDADAEQAMLEEVRRSLEKQKQIEAADTMSFDSYLREYFAKR